jgi:hypothetical protein
MSILGPMLGRPWLRRRHAHLLRDAGRAINEAGYIPAGGIDHFVTIRGASRDSPVLVFLHGGPGATQTVFATETLRWEEQVTVVQYDQRGSGKTRHRNGPAVDGQLSFGRLRPDAIDLIDALRRMQDEPRTLTPLCRCSADINRLSGHSRRWRAAGGMSRPIPGWIAGAGRASLRIRRHRVESHPG